MPGRYQGPAFEILVAARTVFAARMTDAWRSVAARLRAALRREVLERLGEAGPLVACDLRRNRPSTVICQHG